MTRLAPWPPDRAVAVGLSGGADSTALAWLLRRWAGPDGRPPLALVVDHGLRPGSGREAVRAAARARGFGCEVRLLSVTSLVPGPGLQQRARRARHAALADAATAAGLLDLLLGHHAADQMETRMLRRECGSGPDGLAGMSPIREIDALRLVRPLLGIAPERLRATLRAAAIDWDEDPSNADRRFARGRLRAGALPLAGRSAADDLARRDDAAARASRSHATARFVAARATLRDDGIVVLDADRVPVAVLAGLVRAVSGRRYPAAGAALARLAPALRPATLGGVRLFRAPDRLGGGFMLAREPASLAPPVPLGAGACWDDRFRVVGTPIGCRGWTLGALGADTPRYRRRSILPSAALATLPAIRDDTGTIRGVPHLDTARLSGAADRVGDNFRVMFSPRNPLLPSFFTDTCHPPVVPDA